MTHPIKVDAVVMGGSPTGLYAVRELARAGLEVALTDLQPGCAFHSRYVAGRGQCFLGDTEAIEKWLLECVSNSSSKPVLIATSDIFIEFILQRTSELSSRFHFAEAYQGLAEKLLDKSLFHALCQKHGMATPGVWETLDKNELASLAETVPYPCILKPVLIHRARAFLKGKKVLLVQSKRDFVQQVAGMPEGLGGWLVQEIIPGPESAITLFGGYIDKLGEACPSFTGRKLRQYPVGFGSASLVTSEPCEETLRLTLDFLKNIAFKGICGAEYKRDPRDGVLKIIEINPRPTLWFQATHDAGKRIAEAAVRDLAFDQSLPLTPQDETVCWRYGLKDMASAMFFRRDRGRFIFPPPDVTSARKASVTSSPVYSAQDPMPALYEPLGYLRKLWGRRQ